MSELKPCPFCGEIPKVNDWTLKGITDKRCFCDNEKCPVYLSKTIAIDDWNTRPIEDALQSRIAELEKDLSNKEIEYTDLWDDALALQARIAELEAENEKINYFFRRLRMFCIFAHWDNPNTEAEFYNVDAEIREYLSEYKVCIDQLTAHTDIERQDDKWIPEVQE